MIKLILRLTLFLPLLAGMMFVSYRVDPSGLFWGAGFERLASEYMLEGTYIDGYERLDGRALNEVYAKNVPYAPQILINGSSRSLMVDKTVAGDRTFYNTANVGADICDFFTSYYIFAKEGKEPETMIFGIDPWIFNDAEDALDFRSNKELYYEFLGEELGIEVGEYEADDPMAKYEALIDPSYFQASVDYYFKDKSADVQPEPVPADAIYEQNEVIKSPDGAIVYDKGFRTRRQEYADHDAATMAQGIMRMDEFDQLSPTYTSYFEKFIEYLQAKDIEVIFYLPPYHPKVYDAALANQEKYHSLMDVEIYLEETAAEYGIQVYGSYNPYELGLANTDFYDGIHPRYETAISLLQLK